MKITNFMSFGFVPKKPAQPSNTYKNNQSSFDFDNFSKAVTLLNKSLISFSKRIDLSKHREEIEKLHKEGKSVREIASILNCSPAGINNVIKRWNLGKKGNKYQINEEEIIKLYREGKTFKEIMNQTNLSKNIIDKVLKNANIEKRLTPAQENKELIAKFHKQGLTQKQIAEIIGCSQNTISYTLMSMGFNQNRKRRQDRITEPNKDLIIKMYKKGETFKAISEKMGCSMGAIESALKRWQVEKRSYHQLKDYKEEIIKAYKMGATQQEIAQALNCSQNAISKLLIGWGIRNENI